MENMFVVRNHLLIDSVFHKCKVWRVVKSVKSFLMSTLLIHQESTTTGCQLCKYCSSVIKWYWDWQIFSIHLTSTTIKASGILHALPIFMSNIPHLWRDELIMVSQCCHTSPQWAILPSVECFVTCITVCWSLMQSRHSHGPHPWPSSSRKPTQIQTLDLCILQRSRLPDFFRCPATAILSPEWIP